MILNYLLTWLGSLQRSPDPLTDEEGARCSLPKNPTTAASFLRISGCNPLQNWQPY